MAMRRLAQRTPLQQGTVNKLQEKTAEIVAIVDVTQKKMRARAIYNSARQARWFQPVVGFLKTQSGAGEFCMYCSANEPSQVEHYRPLAVFPDRAMEYSNFLWVCDVCNRRHKGDRFPPDTEQGAQILNPIDDNVWDYFFIDEQHGRLLKRINPATNTLFPRAESTCAVVELDRETIQKRRSWRYGVLRDLAQNSLNEFNAGTITPIDLVARISAWRAAPVQLDVADYFLNGPGRAKEPFRSTLIAAGEVV